MNQRRLTSLVLGSDLRFTHQFWLLSVSLSNHLGLLMKFRDKINRSGAKPGLCLIPRAQFMVSYFIKSPIDFLFLLFASFFKRTFRILTTDSTLNSSISVQQILFLLRNFYHLHALLEPPHLLISEKSVIYTVFYVINFKKISPTHPY